MSVIQSKGFFPKLTATAPLASKEGSTASPFTANFPTKGEMKNRHSSPVALPRLISIYVEGTRGQMSLRGSTSTYLATGTGLHGFSGISFPDLPTEGGKAWERGKQAYTLVHRYTDLHDQAPPSFSQLGFYKCSFVRGGSLERG